MRSICLRCALRARIAESRNTTASSRFFSTTTQTRRSALPNFTPTSQPELDDVLASLRSKHLIPAALTNAERNMIYKQKYVQNLIDNPEIVTIGDEDIILEHIDRLKDVPSLKREIVPKIIELMSKGERSDWNQLPELLKGLKKAKMVPRAEIKAKIARKAIEAGQFSVLLKCLQQPELTQMSLKRGEVLYEVIYGLRAIAMNEQWSEAATAKAMRDANEIAKLLESEDHWMGTTLGDGDPRQRPYLLAVWLELHAVYAFKYQDGKDVDGKIKAFTERLLYNIKARHASLTEALQTRVKAGEVVDKAAEEARIRAKAGMAPHHTTVRETGPQMDILHGTPIYHSLLLARHMLGPSMPESKLTASLITTWSQALEQLTQGLKTQAVEKLSNGKKRTIANLAAGKEGRKEGREGVVNRWPKSGTYGWQALRVWRSCLDLEREEEMGERRKAKLENGKPAIEGKVDKDAAAAEEAGDARST